jgi:hypothetical protein
MNLAICPEDGSRIFLQNIGVYVLDYMVSYLILL